MAAQTRDRILDTARDLFNRHGFHQVTLRQIADALHISPGNLTYHFPHKTDIVQALMDESFEKTLSPEPIRSFDDLLAQFRRMLETIRRNAFFFLDRDIAAGGKPHNAMIRERIADGMRYLVSAGVFDASFTPDKQQTVTDILLMSHMSWLRNTVNRDDGMSVDDFIHMHRVILSAYLKNTDP